MYSVEIGLKTALKLSLIARVANNIAMNGD